MKILSIRLKNLASIEGPYEIDFTQEPLCKAGIFAISGSTGAGKSTILDALCLALYDKAPRFASSGESLLLKDIGDTRINQNDVRNILRRGTGEGFAEVLFECINGRRYRSHWHVRRARNKATGALQPQTLQIKDEDTGEELQGTKTELLAQLAELTGLTYNQFTRTVLLAQNDFATFLKSKESAKAELLEKLTGTDIYSKISRVVFRKSKEAMEAFTLLKSHLGLIEVLPDEELKILTTQKGELTNEVARINSQLTLLNNKLKIIQNLNQQQELLNLRRQKEEVQKTELQQLTENYNQYLAQYQHFKSQCEAIQPDIRKARELDIQIIGKQSEYQKNENSYNEVIRKRKELETAVKDKESKLIPAEQLQAYESKLSQLSDSLAGAIKANEERARKLDDFQINKIGEEQSLATNKQRALQDSRQNTVEWLKLRQEVEELTKQQTTYGENHRKLSDELRTLSVRITEKQQQVLSLQRVYEQAKLAISKDVKQLRQNLVPGVECPVCGSKDHPYGGGHEVESLYRNLETEYTTAAAELQQFNNRSITLERDLKHIEEQIKLVDNRLLVNREECEKRAPKYPEHEQLDFFDKHLKDVQHQLDNLRNKLTAYQQLYREWQERNEEINKMRSGIDKLKEILSSSALSIQQAEALKVQLNQIISTENSERERFASVKNELEELKKNRLSLLKGKSAEDAELSIQRKEKEWNDLVEKSKKDVEERKNSLSVLQGELKQITQYIEELIKERNNIESPDDLPKTIELQQTLYQQTERRLSEITNILQQQEANRKKIKDIENQLNEKQAVAERWEKLNKLIGSADGAKFKVIAQSYTLNLLLLHANKHLSYLSKRYKLQQVPDTLALQVIDLDMCDEVRTVYSLSGGESFLISLALALGLSSLSSNDLKVESLFIDEGFGSLDAESLRQAMDALEQLQMQGRKIGVISHVQEMSERIPVQIQILKQANGKSKIKVIGV